MRLPLLAARLVVLSAVCLGTFVVSSLDILRGAPPPRPAEVKAHTIASRPDLIEISIQIPTLQILPPPSTASRPGSRIEMAGATGYSGEDGAELPVIRQFIAIPDCDRVTLRVEVFHVETIKGVRVRPRDQPASPTETAQRPRVGRSEEWARVIDIQHARGQALARVEISPVRYDPSRRSLSYPREIRLQLTPKSPRGPVAVNTGPLHSALGAVVPNLQGVDAGTASAAPGQRSTSSTGQVCWCETGDDDWEAAADYINTYCAPDYLIIVADELLTNEADSLVEQLATKRAEFNGFNVAIARMGQIDTTPHLTSTAADIKNFVNAIYADSSAAHMGDGRLGFVLLLGDAINPAGEVTLPTYVPYPGEYNHESGSTNGALNGADTWYALLDPGNDMVPDLLVGRLPVDADEENWELDNVVGKITSYEPVDASATWTDRILLMSGWSDANFTFSGEGLSGFENFFNSIENLFPNSGKTFVKMHRRATGSGTQFDLLFSGEVCDSIAQGYGVVGLFDHANPVNFQDAFFPVHYDELGNTEKPSLVFSFGSHSGFFDRLNSEEIWCCPSPSYSGLPCESPTTAIDNCDALAERLLVQPAGAIGVLAYPRSHQAPVVQQVFVNAFRSLLQHKQSRLGDLVLATKLLSADEVTSKALNLLGDPALNIGYQFDTVSQDSLDLAVGGLKMAFGLPARQDFAPNGISLTLDVAVSNLWKEDAVSVPVEVWHGPPGEGGSTLLDDFVLEAVAAHDSVLWTASIGSFSAGDYDIHVTVDPDDTLEDPVRSNNVASRTLHVREYAPGFPATAVDSAAAFVSLSLSGAIRNLYRTNERYAVWPGRYLGPPVDGTPVEIYQAGTTTYTYFFVPGTIGNLVVVDHGLPDSMLVAVLTQEGSGGSAQRNIRLYTVSGVVRWTHQIGNSLTAFAFGAFAQAVGDVTGDGVADIVYGFSPQDLFGSVVDSLGVINGKTGGRVWRVEMGDVAFTQAAIRLVDIENDGTLEIVTNTRVSGLPAEDRIQCYSGGGSLLWEIAAGNASGTLLPPTFITPADVDHDGVKEIIFARGTRLGIITASGSSAVIADEVNLTGDGQLVSAPLAVDIDGDDRLEIIVLYRAKNHYLNEYAVELQLYDGDLTLLNPTYAYRWTTSGGSPSASTPTASAGDIDGDGRFEVMFTTPDGLRHAVRVGTTAGREDWASAGGPLDTGIYEQVLGGNYTEPVAINGRARVLSDATFTEGLTITAPADVQVGAHDSLVVENFLAIRGSHDDSVRVRVDVLETAGSRWGAVVYRNATTHGDVRHAVLTSALGGFAHDAPLKVTGSRLTDLADVGVVSRDTLWFEDGVIEGCGESAINAREGAAVLLSSSTIQDCSQLGVVIADESSLDASETSFDGNEIAVYLARDSGSWVKGTLRDCTFTNGAHGVWGADSGDSLITIEDCTIETAATGLYLETARAVVDGTTVRGAQLGINAHTGTSLTVTGSAIEDASLYGLVAYDATVDVSGTSFDGNDVGLDLNTIPCVDPGPPCAYSWVKATVRNCSFTGNGDGLWVENVYDSCVVIDNCLIDNSTTNGVYVEGPGDVAITRNTITNNVIGVYSYESSPMIRSCNSIQYNTGGIKCDNFSTAVVESSTVTNNTNGIVVVNDANPDLGHQSGGSSVGYNILRPNTSFILSNLTGSTVMMENDYLPRNPPSQCEVATTKIYGYADYDPHLGCDFPDLCSPPNMPVLMGDVGLSPSARFELAQNFPNPFNPATTIAFSVPAPGARVEITLYDVAGRRVAELVNGHKTPGRYWVSWDGRNRRGEPVASGVYFLRMRAGTFVETRKLHLIR